MSPKGQIALAQHNREIAKILHCNSSSETVDTLAGIERMFENTEKGVVDIQFPPAQPWARVTGPTGG